jgi:hypothetical protein
MADCAIGVSLGARFRRPPADASGILTSPGRSRDDLPGVKADLNPVGMNLRAR